MLTRRRPQDRIDANCRRHINTWRAEYSDHPTIRLSTTRDPKRAHAWRRPYYDVPNPPRDVFSPSEHETEPWEKRFPILEWGRNELRKMKDRPASAEHSDHQTDPLNTMRDPQRAHARHPPPYGVPHPPNDVIRPHKHKTEPRKTPPNRLERQHGPGKIREDRGAQPARRKHLANKENIPMPPRTLRC